MIKNISRNKIESTGHKLKCFNLCRFSHASASSHHLVLLHIQMPTKRSGAGQQQSQGLDQLILVQVFPDFSVSPWGYWYSSELISLFFIIKAPISGTQRTEMNTINQYYLCRFYGWVEQVLWATGAVGRECRSLVSVLRGQLGSSVRETRY